MMMKMLYGLPVYCNDFPSFPTYENEQIWIYMGEGHYHRLTGINGKWVENLNDPTGHYYNQKES